MLEPGYTIGEAVRQAKCDLVEQGRDTSPNKLQYTLLGDPALKLACPQPDIVIDSINGQSAGSVTQLSAGSVVKVQGHVVSSVPFDGVVTATVQDAKETIVCRLNDESEAEQPFVYEDRTRMLYQGSNSVRNGRFDFTFAVPKDISYDDGNGLIYIEWQQCGSDRFHRTFDLLLSEFKVVYEWWYGECYPIFLRRAL